MCFLTRYDDVVRAFTDKRLVRAYARPRAPERLLSDDRPVTFAAVTNRWMVYQDGVHHTKLRQPILAALSEWTPMLKLAIQDIAARLLNQMHGRSEIDLVAEYAFVIPATVICGVLGLPTEDLSNFRRWTAAFNAALEHHGDPVSWQAADEAASELDSVFRSVLDDMDSQNADTFLHRVRELGAQPPHFSDEDLIANVMLLLLAGHETTMNQIANTLLCLFSHPNAKQALKQDISLLDPVVEAGLRFEAPVQMTYRSAAEDLEWHGVAIPERTRIALVIGSANRDERQFPSPNVFDPFADNRKQLSYGFGPHFCAGAALGRLETQIAVQSLLQHFPQMELTETPITWKNSLTYRALKQLRVRP